MLALLGYVSARSSSPAGRWRLAERFQATSEEEQQSLRIRTPCQAASVIWPILASS